MDKFQRDELKSKIGEITRGFSGLVDHVDTMPDEDLRHVAREIDEFRFRYSKVLNLRPHGREAGRASEH